jgi:hypothetical protein
MAHLEARKDRLAFFLDVVDMNVDEETDGELLRRPVDVDVDLDLLILEFGAAYRFTGGAHDRFGLEGLAGGRYHYAFSEIDVRGAERRRRRSTREDFIDPFLGLRGALRLTSTLSLTFRGDVGGFGVASELAWLALGGLRWDTPWRLGAARVALFAGYKVYDLDYDTGAGDDEVELDLQFRGPAVGASFTF